ncbi:MAG: ABC transporter ATP-binding protein [Phycisphaerales bacterium]|nr:ABC transporter ATP-binding protein [Phycisphaerales bacterium]
MTQPSVNPHAGGPLLEARNLHKTYRLGRVGVPVLRGVDIQIRPGEWVAILGASGSGKSTLMHLLGGLDRPDTQIALPITCTACGYALTGTKPSSCPECSAPVDAKNVGRTIPWDGFIRFQDLDLSRMSAGTLDRYRNESVGFVFQFYHLLPELNVLENALLPAMAKYGRVGYFLKRQELRAKAAELLGTFGLTHRLSHRPAELSGGERQRVAIARALINDPPVVLADEPTGNLDRKTGQAILDSMVQHRAATGRAMVMVTHDQEVAARADRIVRLEDGRVAVSAG